MVPVSARAYFGNENHHVFDDPRVQLVFDDARHFLQTTHEKFDIITSDPIHPWVRGAATLYSLEYLTLAKRAPRLPVASSRSGFRSTKPMSDR